MTDDLERLGRRLAPEVLRALVEHLEGIEGPARSDIVVHHGRDGVGNGIRCHKRAVTVDIRPPGA